jgi:hypothetical protein
MPTEKDLLAALFDMAKHHVALVDFGRGQGPGYDLYSARASGRHQQAMALLAAAGLATPEVWADATFYRLDDEARAALAPR